MRSQPPIPADERLILRKKLFKNVLKRYLVAPDERLMSLIKYFSVPKGVLDGIVQDWRIVYHGGANGLNDAV